jgi:alpha-mannosidase
MQKHKDITLQRLDRFVATKQFHDVNLCSLLWRETLPLTVFTYFTTPNRLLFPDAIKKQFVKGSLNMNMTPSWSTYWLHLEFTIPETWTADNGRVMLLFDPSCEAMVYLPCGTPVSGITGGNGVDRHIDVEVMGIAGERQEFYLEVALNGMVCSSFYPL